MSSQKRFARGSKSYKRSPPRAPLSGTSFLIVTEGEKTEPNYLNSLRNRLQLSVADVEIVHPEGTDPITLTLRAIELRDQRKERARKGGAVEYDEVWVVFDMEKTHDERRKLAHEAKQLRGVEKIQFAISDPSFEYWLLLHWEYTTAPFRDCTSVIKKLKKYWPNYSKGISPTCSLVEKMLVAARHSQQCRKHHESAKSHNPQTNVDILALKMNAATRPHLQISPTPQPIPAK